MISERMSQNEIMGKSWSQQDRRFHEISESFFEETEAGELSLSPAWTASQK